MPFIERYKGQFDEADRRISRGDIFISFCPVAVRRFKMTSVPSRRHSIQIDPSHYKPTAADLQVIEAYSK